MGITTVKLTTRMATPMFNKLLKMTGKSKNLLVIYAIFCVLQRSVAADKRKCKTGVSFGDDREGSSLEEVIGSFVDNTCNSAKAVCQSLSVEEITIKGELKKNVVAMLCFENELQYC